MMRVLSEQGFLDLHLNAHKLEESGSRKKLKTCLMNPRLGFLWAVPEAEVPPSSPPAREGILRQMPER